MFESCISTIKYSKAWLGSHHTTHAQDSLSLFLRQEVGRELICLSWLLERINISFSILYPSLPRPYSPTQALNQLLAACMNPQLHPLTNMHAHPETHPEHATTITTTTTKPHKHLKPPPLPARARQGQLLACEVACWRSKVQKAPPMLRIPKTRGNTQ